jgi:hypothetical protein
VRRNLLMQDRPSALATMTHQFFFCAVVVITIAASMMVAAQNPCPADKPEQCGSQCFAPKSGQACCGGQNCVSHQVYNASNETCCAGGSYGCSYFNVVMICPKLKSGKGVCCQARHADLCMDAATHRCCSTDQYASVCRLDQQCCGNLCCPASSVCCGQSESWQCCSAPETCVNNQCIWVPPPPPTLAPGIACQQKAHTRVSQGVPMGNIITNSLAECCNECAASKRCQGAVLDANNKDCRLFSVVSDTRAANNYTFLIPPPS